MKINSDKPKPKQKPYVYSVSFNRPPKHYQYFLELMKRVQRGVGITQKEFSKEIGLSEAVVSRAFNACAQYHFLVNVRKRTPQFLIDMEFVREFLGKDEYTEILNQRMEENSFLAKEAAQYGVADLTTKIIAQTEHAKIGDNIKALTALLGVINKDE